MATNKIKGVCIAILFGVIFMNEVFAQNKAECQKIVAATVDAINNKTPEQLEKCLATDFTCSGQKAPLASVVLNQLLKQLNEEVVAYHKTDEVENNGELTLVYEFKYAEKLGQRTTTFVFNKDNQLKQLDLFTIQVKTMEKEDTAVEKNDQKTITIPIQTANKIPTAQAIVNGQKRTFYIDNGSPRLILNSKYFDKNYDSKISTSNVQGVNSSVSNMDIVQIEDFDFHGIKITESNVLTMNLSHLEKADTEIYGLIGHEIYKDYDMLFDYSNNTLTLIQPTETEKYLETNYKQSKKEALLIEMSGHIPTVKAKIGDIELNFGIDCGAEINLIDIKLTESLRKYISESEETDLRGAGETKKVESGQLQTLTIGEKEFPNTNTVFNDMSHLNSNYEIALDGLIGYEILSKYKVLLSFQNKRLIFID
ncbi:MAG: retropepsin-like domain-containing protein [Bacteroidales bacterium]|jgi:hypothetical protein|nr:retropepsin-like domain-containing protein [Bacteroidales bacterium]